MSNIDVYGLSGEVVGTMKLPSSVFAAPIRRSLIEQAVSVFKENQRQYTSQVKGRSDVSGGGKKPWRQKGTGRARQGSTRSAQWRGGGIIFGPQAGERRRVALTKKMRARMITSILSWFASEGRIVVLDTMQLPAPNTKQLVKALQAVTGDTTAMFVDPVRNENFVKSLRNVDGWKYQHIDALSVMNLLLPKKLVLSQAAIEVLAKRYPTEQKVKSPVKQVTVAKVATKTVRVAKAEESAPAIGEVVEAVIKPKVRAASKPKADAPKKVAAKKTPTAKKTATTKKATTKKSSAKSTPSN